MKYIILFAFFYITTAHAQNLRTINDFDGIPLTSKRMDVEGYMAEKSFTFNKEYINFFGVEKGNGAAALEFKSSDDKIIHLLFYNSVLYSKTIIFSYSLSEHKIALEEYKNIKSIILSKGNVKKKSESELSNKIYGAVGTSEGFYINSDFYKYAKKELIIQGELEFDDKFTIAKLINYKVVYKSTNLNKSGLNSKKGYASMD